MSGRPAGDPLGHVADGSARGWRRGEAFERQLQQLYRGGYRHLEVDLSGASPMDGAGIRARVRGHTTAQRVGGTLRLAAAPKPVANGFELAHLAGVFELFNSVD